MLALFEASWHIDPQLVCRVLCSKQGALLVLYSGQLHSPHCRSFSYAPIDDAELEQRSSRSLPPPFSLPADCIFWLRDMGCWEKASGQVWKCIGLSDGSPAMSSGWNLDPMTQTSVAVRWGSFGADSGVHQQRSARWLLRPCTAAGSSCSGTWSC